MTALLSNNYNELGIIKNNVICEHYTIRNIVSDAMLTNELLMKS